MRILTLDSALSHVSVGWVEDGSVRAERMAEVELGKASRLAVLVRELLWETCCAAAAECVAVTLGPGGFTGIRAALALAHGLGLGAGIPVIGVTVGEALEAARSPDSDRRPWIAIDNRRGRVFLEIAGKIVAVELDSLPLPDQPIEVLGDAAPQVVARLAGAGVDAVIGEARWPVPLGIARAALARLKGALPPRPVQPVYVEPPAVKPPSSGLRPEPVG
jgi:tRNA threonylcarbamoyladenosine biosynthesis protein TsaB